MAGLIGFSIHAAIDYTPWTSDNMSDQLKQAKAEKQMVMVVVTQPDWCPPCIQLENRVIKNPDESVLSPIAKDWLVLEIFGYDAEGAEFLKQQELKFHGTPTVFLLDPNRSSSTNKSEKALAKLKNKLDLKLGDLKVIHSVAGIPDDFTTQFVNAANGLDLLAEAQKMVREEQSLEAYKTLADAYVNFGNVKSANRVYQSILMRDDLLDEEIRDIKWEQIFQVTQRVEKDHAATVKAIDTFVERYPEFVEDKANYESYAYRRAWSLVEIDRVDEANTLLKKAYVDGNEVGNLRTYMYFAFRNPHPELLADAKVICDKALEEFPESEASLRAAEGRLLRRFGELEKAQASFTRAIELLDPEGENYAEDLEIYQGQLDFVLSELAKSKSKDSSS